MLGAGAVGLAVHEHGAAGMQAVGRAAAPSDEGRRSRLHRAAAGAGDFVCEREAPAPGGARHEDEEGSGAGRHDAERDELLPTAPPNASRNSGLAKSKSSSLGRKSITSAASVEYAPRHADESPSRDGEEFDRNQGDAGNEKQDLDVLRKIQVVLGEQKQAAERSRDERPPAHPGRIQLEEDEQERKPRK